jgi:hypothetical protein
MTFSKFGGHPAVTYGVSRNETIVNQYEIRLLKVDRLRETMHVR